MNKCTKIVAGPCCHKCKYHLVKHGLINSRQRYRCKNCNSTQMETYINKACSNLVNSNIISYVKEGCGIRSISRLLNISTDTVMRRISYLAGMVRKPSITHSGVYEVDELRTLH